MVRRTPIRLPRMTRAEIRRLISEQMICRIVFRGEDQPHVAPFQYVVLGGKLYFHFTDYGRKMQLLVQKQPVCVEIESFAPDLSEYRFVVLTGLLRVVDDPAEKSQAIQKIAAMGERRLSQAFLAAHGFRPEQGWSSLGRQTNLVIAKLDHVIKTTGLKSPSVPTHA